MFEQTDCSNELFALFYSKITRHHLFHLNIIFFVCYLSIFSKTHVSRHHLCETKLEMKSTEQPEFTATCMKMIVKKEQFQYLTVNFLFLSAMNMYLVVLFTVYLEMYLETFR